MGVVPMVRISFDNSEETYIDRYADRYKAYNALVNARWFTPLKPGETTRRCEACGAEYVPRSRAQKYCCGKCAEAARRMRKAR